MSKSQYFYDYTRNMSVEQELKAQRCCGKPDCLSKKCKTVSDEWAEWAEELDEREQTSCKSNNPDGCINYES